MTIQNTYLRKIDDIEKRASAELIAGIHIGQNALTNLAIHSKRFGKSLANSAAEGVAGVKSDSLLSKVDRVVRSVASPETVIMKDRAHAVGQALSSTWKSAPKRSKVGIRMLTEGRFDALKKRGLMNDPHVEAAHTVISNHLKGGIPSLEKIRNNTEHLQKVFQDKKYPLLSNILSQSTRGKVGANAKPFKAKPSGLSDIAASASLAAVEPIAGAVNTAKFLTTNPYISKTSVGKKMSDFADKYFVRDPAKIGIENASKPEARSLLSKAVRHAKILGKRYVINPVSSHVQETSEALKRAVDK